MREKLASPVPEPVLSVSETGFVTINIANRTVDSGLGSDASQTSSRYVVHLRPGVVVSFLVYKCVQIVIQGYFLLKLIYFIRVGVLSMLVTRRTGIVHCVKGTIGSPFPSDLAELTFDMAFVETSGQQMHALVAHCWLRSLAFFDEQTLKRLMF